MSSRIASFNAFAILGGNLFICKGVFDTGVSDAALQSIIAHEIAHVELEHCVKGSAVAIRAGEVAGSAAAGLASMLHEIVRLSYSIEQEFEADLFAYRAQRSLQLSKDQCLESLRLLARLTRPETPVDAPAPRPSTIMDELAAHVCTHPDTAERIRRLELEP
jgi:Zn-dependent protease with chaperone function